MDILNSPTDTCHFFFIASLFYAFFCYFHFSVHSSYFTFTFYNDISHCSVKRDVAVFEIVASYIMYSAYDTACSVARNWRHIGLQYTGDIGLCRVTFKHTVKNAGIGRFRNDISWKLIIDASPYILIGLLGFVYRPILPRLTYCSHVFRLPPLQRLLKSNNLLLCLDFVK